MTLKPEMANILLGNQEVPRSISSADDQRLRKRLIENTYESGSFHFLVLPPSHPPLLAHPPTFLTTKSAGISRK
jgi:hypothetical protein